MQPEFISQLVYPILVPLIIWCVSAIWLASKPNKKRNAVAGSIILSTLAVGLWFWTPGGSVPSRTDHVETPPHQGPTQPPSAPPPREPERRAPVAPARLPKPRADDVPPAAPEQRSSQFVNRGLVTAGGRAALVVNAGHGTDMPATEQLAKAIDAVDSLFKPAFVNEGLFTDAHRGNLDVLKGLGIDNMDMIALGVKSVAATHDHSVDVTRATVDIVVRVIRPSSGFSGTTLAVHEVGVGFDADRADSNGSKKAFEKLTDQLKRIGTATGVDR